MISLERNDNEEGIAVHPTSSNDLEFVKAEHFTPCTAVASTGLYLVY